ncbi:MAG TPA: hypothetical protein GX719_08645 [Gammaproteobacteria bacterium]|nr:hypothetical protein [Gammaproteobacteria bacterium]
MKIRKLTFGFIVAGLFLTFGATVVHTPTGAVSLAQICEANPMQCAQPQNLSAAHFPLQNW